MNNEKEIKIERLRKMLELEKLGGVLINAQHNFAWLTEGRSNGINKSVENGTCFLLIRDDGKSFILSNNIEMPRILSEEISAEDFEPVGFSWQEEKSSGNFIVELAKSLLLENKEIGSDLFLVDRIRPIENLISKCRYILTASETERFRKLGKDANVAVANVIRKINVGETENEVARKTRDELAKLNIDAVVTLVGADKRIEQFRHPVPTENIWKQILLIAICAKRDGLIANLSRILSVGKVSSELQRKTEAAAFVFARLLSETKPETTGSELYKIAAAAYTEKGFSNEINLHHQGGATGYKTRDWVIQPKSNEKVFCNQAFAWNPSITGTKVEETAIVSENGIEIITESPNFPQITSEIGGIEYYAPDILRL